MIQSSNTYAVYEARVRKFDPITMIATVIMPGVYGMEPIESPPFTRGPLIPENIAPLQVGDRVLVVQGENEVPEWLSANPDRYVSQWNTSWGVVQIFPTAASPVTMTGAAVPLTNSISFTFTAGRRFRVFSYVRAINPAGGVAMSGGVDLFDGATNLQSVYGGSSHFDVSLAHGFATSQWIIDGADQTYAALHIRMSAANGSLAYVDRNAVFYIEDIGPITRLPGGMPSPFDFGWSAYDARFVNITGDTMTGALSFQGQLSEHIRLYKWRTGDWAFMSFYDEDKTTRRGYIGVAPNDDIGLGADTGNIALNAGTGVTLNGSTVITLNGSTGTVINNGLNVASTGPGGYALNVASGPNFIHGGLNVADGGLSVGGGGLVVQSGGIISYGGTPITAYDGINVAGGYFYVTCNGNNAISLASAGSGSVSIQGGSTGSVSIASGTGNWVSFNAGLGYLFYMNGTEYGRIGGPSSGAQFMWGKQTSGGGNKGIELSPNGGINSTTYLVNDSCLYLRQTDSASQAGQCYALFYETTGTEMARITREVSSNRIHIAGATIAAPSDYRWKNDLGPVIDALDRVMQLKPRHLEWKEGGDPFDGFFAHEVQEVVPSAVSGVKDEVYTDEDEAKLAGKAVGDDKQQQLDMDPLIPLLTAALQELRQEVVSLRAEVAELRGTAPAN